MRTYPMPMPFGWFQLAWSDEIPPATSKPIVAFGQHLAVWRDELGTAHVWDAFCPHLGAHFGHRATIKGESITCALHGWVYGVDGKVIDIPYSDRLNQKACVRTYPVVERNGILMAWYHPEGEAPSWDIPELPEFADGSDFSEVFRKSYALNCHWQEIAETQADAAHIQAHLIEYQTAMNGGVRPDDITTPRVDAYNTDGPIAEIRLSQDFPTPAGAVEGRIDTDVVGPGFAATWFTGLVDTLLIGCATPTGPGSCSLHYSFVVRKSGDERSTSSLGRAFIEEIHERTVEDVEVWENKAYVARPALARGDGPIMQFRRWCEQFYFEGVDRDLVLATPELAGSPVDLVDAP